MATGVCKWFSAAKGYGFLKPDQGDRDVFVHVSEVERSGIGELRDGDKISFDITKQRGKSAATNLKRVA